MPGLGNRHADGGTMSHILDNDLVVATGLQCEFGFRQLEEAVLGWLKSSRADLSERILTTSDIKMLISFGF